MAPAAAHAVDHPPLGTRGDGADPARRRHRDRGWRGVHQRFRVHRGPRRLPRRGRALRRHRPGHRDERLHVEHGAAGRGRHDRRGRRLAAHRHARLQLLGDDAGARRARPRHLRLQRPRARPDRAGRHRRRQPERAVLRRPDRRRHRRAAGGRAGVHVRQLAVAARRRGALAEGRGGRGDVGGGRGHVVYTLSPGIAGDWAARTSRPAGSRSGCSRR